LLLVLAVLHLCLQAPKAPTLLLLLHTTLPLLLLLLLGPVAPSLLLA
jgi:hypothetical protein